MYETGPWQMSVAGTLSYNDNGNGSQSLLNVISGTSATLTNSATTSATAFGTNQNTGALAFGTESAMKIEVGANYALGPGVKLTGVIPDRAREQERRNQNRVNFLHGLATPK